MDRCATKRTWQRLRYCNGRPYKNGLTQLSFCLESHYPIDLVIFWLGTNDTKIQYRRSAEEIGEGMRELIHIVKPSNKGLDAQAPKILLITPQPAIKVTNIHPQIDATSIKKTQQLASVYQALSNKERCEFLDAGQSVSSSPIDGVHLDETEQIKLGKLIAKKVAQILASKEFQSRRGKGDR